MKKKDLFVVDSKNFNSRLIVGTGGRAGRVHYETLVAASSMTGDGEDLATPDE